MDTSPLDFQSQMFFGGSSFHRKVLKTGALGVGFKLFASHGSYEFSTYVTMPGVGFMARLCVTLSYLFQCGYFLIHPVYRSHSVSEFLSGGTASRVATDLACPWEKGVQEVLILPSWVRASKWLLSI